MPKQTIFIYIKLLTINYIIKVINNNDDKHYMRSDAMDLLKRLETKANEYWRRANAAQGLERQRLLAQHREAYEQLKRHRKWLTVMGVQL